MLPGQQLVHRISNGTETIMVDASVNERCRVVGLNKRLLNTDQENGVRAVNEIEGLETQFAEHPRRAHEEGIKMEIEEMLKEQFLQSSTSLTRFETSSFSEAYWKGKIVEIAVLRAANGSVWNTSHPFASLLCKSWFPWLLCVVISSLLLSLGAYLSLSLQQNLVRGFRFRFTTLELRDGTATNITSPGIRKIGFLQDGCGYTFANLQSKVDILPGRSLIISFTQPITINGWWFQTADHTPLSDPVRFVFERSIWSTGDDWELAGASSATLTWSGTVRWSATRYETTLLRNATQSFNLDVPWIWTAHRVSCNSMLVLMAILILAAGRMKYHLHGKWIAAFFLSVNALLNFAYGLTYALRGQWQVAIVAGGFSIVDCGLPSSLIFAEHALLGWVGAAGVGYPALVLIHYLLLVRWPAGLAADSGLALIRNVGLLEGVGYLGLFVFGFYTRLQAQLAASIIIQEDWAKYDACWIAIYAKDSSVLQEMQQFTVAIASRISVVPRQPDKQPAAALLSDRVSFQGARCASTSIRSTSKRLIHRLDQLFVQAAGLDIFLRWKCAEWALMSGGCFPVCSGDSESECCYIRFDKIMSRGLESQVKWTQIKSRDRALEKVYRCYRLDSSRLLDCCRQSIYFEDTATLLKCLRTVASDEAVLLARVSNRLLPAYDTAATAGFRSVLLNFALKTDDTCRLHLDTTICELQLSHIDFAHIKVWNP